VQLLLALVALVALVADADASERPGSDCPPSSQQLAPLSASLLSPAELPLLSSGSGSATFAVNATDAARLLAARGVDLCAAAAAAAAAPSSSSSLSAAAAPPPPPPPPPC